MKLFLQILNRKRLGPRLERRFRRGVLEHVVVGLERHTVVGDVVPGIVHVDVELRSGEQFESRGRMRSARVRKMACCIAPYTQINRGRSVCVIQTQTIDCLRCLGKIQVQGTRVCVCVHIVTVVVRSEFTFAKLTQCIHHCWCCPN